MNTPTQTIERTELGLWVVRIEKPRKSKQEKHFEEVRKQIALKANRPWLS